MSYHISYHNQILVWWNTPENKMQNETRVKIEHDSRKNSCNYDGIGVLILFVFECTSKEFVWCSRGKPFQVGKFKASLTVTDTQTEKRSMRLFAITYQTKPTAKKQMKTQNSSTNWRKTHRLRITQCAVKHSMFTTHWAPVTCTVGRCITMISVIVAEVS